MVLKYAFNPRLLIVVGGVCAENVRFLLLFYRVRVLLLVLLHPPLLATHSNSYILIVHNNNNKPDILLSLLSTVYCLLSTVHQFFSPTACGVLLVVCATVLYMYAIQYELRMECHLSSI